MEKKGSGGRRKHGRNKVKCTKYKLENRRGKNKIRKWQKLIKDRPDNNMRKELENNIKKTKNKIVIG